MVEKLANWVAKGNARNAGCLYNFRSREFMHAAVALSDFDKRAGSGAPDLNLRVKSKSYSLLQGSLLDCARVLTACGCTASFKSPTAPPVQTSLPWDVISANTKRGAAASCLIVLMHVSDAPEPLFFVAQGTGQVDVSVGLQFVPSVASRELAAVALLTSACLPQLIPSTVASSSSEQFAD